MKARFLALFLLTATLTNAQQVMLWQAFDQFQALSITEGWTHQWSGGVPWRAELPYLAGSCMSIPGNSKSENKVAYITDCVGGLGNPNQMNVVMKSPLINFTNIVDGYLRFSSWFRGVTVGSITEKATVEVSTDSGATWTVLMNVPANPSPAYWGTQYVNLSAYNNFPGALKFAFRYSDQGQSMLGWSVDNIRVYVPTPHDLMLVKVNPDDSLATYCVVGDSMYLGGVVYNSGTEPVTEFRVHYQHATGPVWTQTFTGINLPAFDTMTFLHQRRFPMPSLGRQDMKMWVTLAQDTVHMNDTVRFTVRGASFIPKKLLLVEEGAGTWSEYGPFGITYLHIITSGDFDACAVSVHDGDPMMDTTYADFMFSFRQHYVPYFSFDRRMDVGPGNFMSEYMIQKDYFGFANITVKPWMRKSNDLRVDVEITPAVNITEECRLLLVLTENKVHGTTTGWEQLNRYAGGIFGPMGGYENRPYIVPADSMFYDFTARSMSPSPTGSTCLHVPLLNNQTYNCSIPATIKPGWVLDNMVANVFLVRNKDSMVLNTAKMPLARLGIAKQGPGNVDFRLYPNPSHGDATLAFSLSSPDAVMVSITDITGRVLQTIDGGRRSTGPHLINFSTAAWAPGMYLVTLQTGNDRYVRKLEVLD